MIVFKEIKDDKSTTTITYAGYENDELFGKCKIRFEGEVAFLEHLNIISKFRGSNLGEGLLRFTLNKLDKMGIKKVYYDSFNSYLVQKGFIKEDNRIYVELPQFFSIPCSSCNKKIGEKDNEI